MFLRPMQTAPTTMIPTPCLTASTYVDMAMIFQLGTRNGKTRLGRDSCRPNKGQTCPCHPGPRRIFYVLWMDKLPSHHLRIPGVIRPPVHANKQWLPMVSKWGKISSIFSILQSSHHPSPHPFSSQANPGGKPRIPRNAPDVNLDARVSILR